MYPEAQSSTYIFGQHVSIRFSSGPIQGYTESKFSCILVLNLTRNGSKHVVQKCMYRFVPVDNDFTAN